ncbi:MAG: hypothetical protein AB1757_12510 [Acidobacteriota bacterium]
MTSEPVTTKMQAETTEMLPVTNEPEAQKISTTEILLAGLSSLFGFTALLLKLPYRSPVRNSFLTMLVLSAFYFYLRIRLKIRFPMQMILFLVFAVIIDIIGNQFGLFSTRVIAIPYDTLTHFLSSAVSVLPVMWLLLTIFKRYGYKLPLGFIAFFSATATFSLAAYYEITELIDERLFGGQRIWTPRDTSQDLASDLTGIIIGTVIYTLVIRKRWHRENQESNQSSPSKPHDSRQI